MVEPINNKDMEKNMICPYCGSDNVRELTWDEKNELVREYGQSSDYICEDCEYLFDEDDIVWEELRHEISHRLIDTDEKRPIVFSADNMPIIGENNMETNGLSTLEMLHIDRIFQIPGDGTIWFHIDGEYDESDVTGLMWHDIDENDYLNIEDLRKIISAIDESGTIIEDSISL